MNEENNFSILIITSPSISNPSTYIIESTINSLKLLQNIENKQILIILDGYKLSNKLQTKKGKITNEIKLNYELYYNNLLKLYSNNVNYKIIQLNKHYGYSYCVKIGLELCLTKYCLILQHDRKFCIQFNYMNNLLECLKNNINIRYIGFPTIASMNHCIVLQSRYGLTSLVTNSNSRIFIKDNEINTKYELQPTIFWYDSNHLCNVEKYLEIFTPYLSMPNDLRVELEKYDPNILNKLILKPGDFIEDRFGQAQRNILAKLKDNPELLIKAHNWFGSYLLYSPSKRQRKEDYRQVHLKYCENNSISENNQTSDYENEFNSHSDSENENEQGDENENENEQSDENEDYDQQIPSSTITNPYAFNSSKIMVVHLRGRHFDPNSKQKWTQEIKQQQQQNQQEEYDEQEDDKNELSNEKNEEREEREEGEEEVDIGLGITFLEINRSEDLIENQIKEKKEEFS